MKKLLLLLLFVPFLGIGQIQTQIDSASAGDVINIPSGIYVENLVINKSISLIGSPGAVLDVSGHGTGISISQDVTDVTIDGLTIMGDDSTYSGITVSPGATNITLTNNTIRDVLLLTGNPSNASPLSYGILCWGNTTPVNPPTNIIISQNDISNVSGSAISLGTNTESVSITGNNFNSILPILLDPMDPASVASFGIQAELSNDLNINNNTYDTLIIANSLINCTNTFIHSNIYNASSLMLSTSWPHTVSFYDNPWWSTTGVDASANMYEFYVNDTTSVLYRMFADDITGFFTQSFDTSMVTIGCLDTAACTYDINANSHVPNMCYYNILNEIVEISCDSFYCVLNDSTYTSSTIDTLSVINFNGSGLGLGGNGPAGCDSTTILNLTINIPLILNDTACDSYTWNGTTYTSSGTYIWVDTNATGCDSTATLELIINNTTSAEIHQQGSWLVSGNPGFYPAADWYNTQVINGVTKNWLMTSNETSFQPTFDCYYFIITQDENGCADTSDVYYFGATANRVGNINTSPNPTNGELTIEFENEKNQTVLFKLLNSKGEILRHYVSTTNNIKTNLNKYPSGIYYLEFDSSKNREGCAGEEKQKTIKKIILNK